MSLKIRLARAGAKKRPFYRIVVADSRFPRDGRFIEIVGTWNPILPKNDPKRVTLVTERIQHWMSKGAQPTDRVLRFLDAAGLAKRAARNNPQKAVPGKKAQERAGAAAAAGWRAPATPDLCARTPPLPSARGPGGDVRSRHEPHPSGRGGADRRRPRHQGRGAVKSFTAIPMAMASATVRWRRRMGARSRSRPRAGGGSSPDMLVVQLQGHRRPQRRRDAERHRAVGAAGASATGGGGRVLPRRPHRPCRGHRRRRAAGDGGRRAELRRRRPPRDRAAAGNTILVPFTEAVVPEIDVAAGRVIVDPPPGLFGNDTARKRRDEA